MSVQSWCISHFNELNPLELYEILRLRMQVFVLEQHCFYQDLDNLDQTAYHLCARNQEGKLLAYARILEPGVKFQEASVGRILTAKIARGQGLGKELIVRAIEFVASKFSESDILISAQSHLEVFYNAFGFTKVSEPYEDAGIMHIDMLRGEG